MRLFKLQRPPKDFWTTWVPDWIGTGYLKEPMGSPTLPAGQGVLTDDICPIRTRPLRERHEVVTEGSALVREQADRTHQDVLQMLSKIKDEDPVEYHQAHERDDIVGSTTVTGPGKRQSSPAIPVRVADAADLRRLRIPAAAPDTTSMQEPRPKMKGERKKASTPDRLAGLRSSLLPPLLTVGAPPVLPLLLPAFSRKSRRLPQAKASLYFALELPNLGNQRGGAAVPSTPCLPLTLPLPSVRNIKPNNPLSYISAVSTLQRYFFHGVPLPFFQRFFPLEKVLLDLENRTITTRSRRQGGGDRKRRTTGRRSSLVWNIPQLFSPGYKYRALVEQVWEGGKAGLGSSWVDAGNVLFAGKLLTLLGKIAELEREAGEEECGRGGGRGGEVTTNLDITVVVRQYCYDGRTPMDIRRLRKKNESRPPRGRGLATPAGPNFPDIPPEKRAVAQAEPWRPYHHYERHCGPVMVAKRKGLREEAGLASSLRAEGR